jgi:exonuclease III
MSDLRMGEIQNQNATHKISAALLKTKLADFDFFFNSSSNKRGVAMLIKKSLEFTIVNEFSDLDENILIKKFSKSGAEIILGAIYGPNTTNRTFYNNLTRYLSLNNTSPVVLAGDWNTTWDGSQQENNIDIINMARPPNATNGALLREMADNFNLVDPFRALNPDKIAFSYRPFGMQRKNMSRIDFFLVSSSLLEIISDSDVFSAHISSAFDHKPVSLYFTDKNKTEF